MRRLLFFLLAIITSVTFVNAGKVTEQQALEKAQKFMPNRLFLTNKSAPYGKSGVRSNESSFFIFNVENDGGFVIVSGDDRTETILGYSLSGSLDIGKVPDNLRYWLDLYAEQIQNLTDDYQPAMNHTTRSAQPAIEPLIKTEWNQGNPYNLMCPQYGEEHCVTGCVATALAQVMNYYQWPKTCAAIPAYSNLKELPSVSFAWDKMKNRYEWDETGEAADAVAELMRYCGQINEMSYSLDASSAYLHTNRLISLFNYSKNMHLLSREGFTNSQWEGLIYEELENGRPVLYSGSSMSGGHQFICDGYDGNGLFHINWGWGGYSDGYFVLSLANPYGKGIGGGTGTDGFSSNQDALFGFMPAAEDEYDIPLLSSYNVSFNSSDYTRTSTTQDFESVAANGYIQALYNQDPANSLDLETGWGLYQNGTFICCLGSETKTINASKNSSVNNDMTMTFGADLADGKYQLCQIFRMQGTTDWTLCNYSAVEALVVEINGTTMTVRKIDSGTVSFIVNDIGFSDDPEIGSAVDITVSLTNDGESVQQKVYFWTYENNTWKKNAYTIASIDPGCSGSITMSYIPTLPGTFDVKITSDSGGNEVKGSGTITIADVIQTTIDGLTYACNLISKKATIIAADEDSQPEVLTIPTSIPLNNEDYQVKAIGSKAFYFCWAVEKIVIPEGVSTISDLAFAYCSAVCKLELPSTLTKIGSQAFYGCNSLSAVILHQENPFAIDETAFDSNIGDLYASATLYVPVGSKSQYLTVTGWKEFETIVEGELKEESVQDLNFWCSTGEKTAIVVKSDPTEADLTIPSSITVDGVNYAVIAVDNNAFWNKNNIVNLTIQEGIKKIGERAFQYCYNLEKVDLPSTITQIGSYAFANCQDLSSVVTRMENPCDISNNVFGTSSRENNVETITPPTATLCVPLGTTAIYKEKTGWKEFPTILEGEIKTVTIDDMTYEYVTGPKTAVLIEGNPTGPDLTVSSSVTIDGVSYAVTAIDKLAFSNNDGIVNLVIQDGIQTIGQKAFLYCSGLKKVDLPASLTQIDDYAFANCNNLSSAVVRMENPCDISDDVFNSVYWYNGVKTNIPPTATLYVPLGTTAIYKEKTGWKEFPSILEGEMKTVTLNDITYDYATGSKTAVLIEGNPAGPDLTIPSSITVDDVKYAVTAVNKSAFWNKNKIKNLTIQDGIRRIGENAFQYCYGLKSVDLPASLTQIDDYAFAGCGYLTSVVVRMERPCDISNKVFGTSSWNNNVETITPPTATLHVPVGTVSLYQDAFGWKEFPNIEEIAVVLPTTVTAKSFSIVYGDDLPTYDYTVDGSELEGIPAIACEAKKYSPVGTYPIVISAGSITNENTTYVNGLLTITQAPLTIKAGTYSKTQGEDNPEFTLTYEGFKNNETSAVLTKLPTVSCLATKDSEPGEYEVTVSGAEAQNYKISYVAGKLTVSKADEGGQGGEDIENKETIKISAAKQLPYCSDKDLDFTDKPELKAYVATGYDKTTGTIWLTRVKDVPANTGFLIMGDAGDYDIPVKEGGSNSYYTNMFKGTLEKITLQTTETIGGKEYTNYYLSNGEQGVGFYKVTKAEGQSLNANRAYLPIPTEIPAVGTAGGTEAIKVSAAGQVPYYSANSLDFTDMPDVKAYTATGYDYKSGTIWLTRVKKVPAETGILIMAPEGDYPVPTTSVATIYENMFKGSLTEQTIQMTETVAGVDYVNYYLSKGDYGVGFYKVGSDGVKLGANRCYLPIPKQSAGTRGIDDVPANFSIQESDEVIGLRIFGNADGNTGIETNNREPLTNNHWYNLQGQRVENPGKGIFIRNGKKVIIR